LFNCIFYHKQNHTASEILAHYRQHIIEQTNKNNTKACIAPTFNVLKVRSALTDSWYSKTFYYCLYIMPWL